MIRLLRHAALAVCVLVVATLSSHAAKADRRVALVIGNAKYEHAGTLVNTINDAHAIAALLTKAGFNVVDERRDVGVVEFKRAVREFLNSAANADIAVVYYSGHGVEVGGTNYLIPVDAKLASTDDMEDETVSLDRVLTASQPARKLSLIILDACRDNPFVHAPARPATTRSIGNRISTSVEPTSANTLIAYAAKAGSVSYDGNGANSPFTTALVRYIAEPGLDIRKALGKVRDDVLEATGDKQEPFVYGSLGGDDVSLVPPIAPKPAPAPAPADPSVAIAHEYEMAERVGGREAWEAFLALHASGFYADLARAQLAKLVAAEGSNAASAKEQADRIAALQREEADRRAQEGARLKAEHDAAQARADQAAAAPTIEQACKRDAMTLASLRANPSAARVAQFAHDLACADLRPQVQRLAESLGPEPAMDAAKSAPPPPPAPQGADLACKRDEARLAQLRANPSLAEATLFARGLACEDLRPQVQRLMESMGAEPISRTQSAALTDVQARGVPDVDGPQPDAPLDKAEACKRDGETLARLRAHPDRASVARFAKDLKCDDLRTQAARLLESVGN
jgi:uncharacterized caspase-like protein